MMWKTILAGTLMAAVLLGVPFAAIADAGHGHNDQKTEKAGGGGHHESSEGHGEHGDHSDMKSASPAAAWTALMAARDGIASDIERGDLGDIHEKSEPLTGLATALLEQSGDLDASKRARVKGAVKQVARVAEALHTSADGEDMAKTKKQLSRLDGLLKLIKAQYPDGMLGMEGHHKDGHGDHSSRPTSTNDHGGHAHRERPSGVVARNEIARRAY